jgi:tRNA1Val (adenine37-N6)-methyltransferase
LGEGRRNPDPRKEIARHEVACTLSDVFRAAVRYLSPRGRFAMIGLPQRLPEILACAADAGIFPERLRFVHPYADRPANLLLFSGSRRKPPELSVLPALAVYASRGWLHPEMERIYRRLTPP